MFAIECYLYIRDTRSKAVSYMGVRRNFLYGRVGKPIKSPPHIKKRFPHDDKIAQRPPNE